MYSITFETFMYIYYIYVFTYIRTYIPSVMNVMIVTNKPNE